MLWYEILCICAVCFVSVVYTGFIIYCVLKQDKQTDNSIIGVASYCFQNFFFTSITCRRGYYSLTTKDGVFLLPTNATKIHLYKEKSYEKQN